MHAIDSLTVQISICIILATKLLQSCSRNDTFEDWRRCRTAIAVQSSRQQLHCDMFVSTDMHTECIHNHL